jgi:hypothetical protein
MHTLIWLENLRGEPFGRPGCRWEDNKGNSVRSCGLDAPGSG